MTDTSPETIDGFSFRGGHPALDLCATLTGRAKPTPRDLLGDSGDLGRWLVAAGFAPAGAPDQDDLATAGELREAIYALATARIAGSAPPRTARAALNRLAAQRGASPRLEESGLVVWTDDTSALLATLASDAARLLGGPQAARIRQCAWETCTRLFIDASRAGDRRWCSMTACGNRAKVAEFRRRQKRAD
jgi:predicted RNA-binding Zn ribbon-like protein